MGNPRNVKLKRGYNSLQPYKKSNQVVETECNLHIDANIPQQLNAIPVFCFENCEWFMRWTPASCSDYNKLIALVQSQFSLRTIQELSSGPALLSQENQACINENKLFNVFEQITQFGALSFFHLKIGCLLEARNYLKIALETLSQCIQEKTISEDYSESFGYVLGLLALYATQVEESLSVIHGVPFEGMFTEFKWIYSVLKSFEFQSSKVKAGIYGMKIYYLKIVQAHLNGILNVIRTTVELDPDYFEWYLCLQSMVAAKRKQDPRCETQKPWKEEKNSVVTANKLAPDHPRCMLAEISYLSDLVQARTREFPNDVKYWTKFNYESHNFSDIWSLVTFIKDKAIRIFHMMPTSVAANTIIADIFTMRVPQEFADFGFAKYCLDRCIHQNPWSVEANYRMGEYFVNLGHPEAILYSTVYLNTALVVDENHFPVICELVKILMQDISGNETAIFELIQAQSKKPSITTSQFAHLQFLNGLVHFARGKYFQSVNCFENAFKIHPESLNFHSLVSLHERYFWPAELKITAEKIHLELTNLLGKMKGEKKIQFLQLLISIVDEGGVDIRANANTRRRKQRKTKH